MTYKEQESVVKDLLALTAYGNLCFQALGQAEIKCHLSQIPRADVLEQAGCEATMESAFPDSDPVDVLSALRLLVKGIHDLGLDGFAPGNIIFRQ